MCLAKSCWRICGVSSLNHQLALLAVHSSCCHVPRHLWKNLHWVTHSTLVSLCRGLPATQQTDEGERTRQCHGRGFTHRCLQNTHCSHRLHMTKYFSHFIIGLILLLFGPQVQNLSVPPSSVSLSTLAQSVLNTPPQAPKEKYELQPLNLAVTLWQTSPSFLHTWGGGASSPGSSVWLYGPVTKSQALKNLPWSILTLSCSLTHNCI